MCRAVPCCAEAHERIYTYLPFTHDCHRQEQSPKSDSRYLMLLASRKVKLDVLAFSFPFSLCFFFFPLFRSKLLICQRREMMEEAGRQA